MLREAKKNFLAIAAIAGAGLIALPSADAASISNDNSTITFDTTGGGITPFITGWTVDGINQYGAATSTGEAAGEYLGYVSNGTIDNITSLPVINSSFSGNIGTVEYQGNGFTVSVMETLLGGSPGSGSSSLSETVTINNTGTSTLSANAGQYVHLTLDGVAGKQTTTLSPSSGTNTATVTNTLGTKYTDVMLPTPTFVGVSNSGIAGFDEGSLGPITGDSSFGFGWSGSIDAGGSEIFSITETLSGVTSPGSVVPLPNSAASALATLVGLGAISFARRTRRTA